MSDMFGNHIVGFPTTCVFAHGVDALLLYMYMKIITVTYEK